MYNRILAIRKEKSRDAARSRRGKENYEFYELAKVLLSSCYHQKCTFVIMLSPKRYFCQQIFHLHGTVIAFVIKVIIFKVYLLLSYSMFFCRHPMPDVITTPIITKLVIIKLLKMFSDVAAARCHYLPAGQGFYCQTHHCLPQVFHK